MRTWTGFLGYLDGIWIRRHDAGLDTCLLVDAHHLNPNRTVHGGVLLSLLDYTLGGTTEQVLAISNHNDPEASRQHSITISLTTQFTGGARHDYRCSAGLGFSAEPGPSPSSQASSRVVT
jgi:hypothetical protein